MLSFASDYTEGACEEILPVSYTHLTLPTSCKV